MLALCHADLSNIYKRINRRKVKIQGIVSNCAVILLVLSSFAEKNINWNCYSYNCQK